MAILYKVVPIMAMKIERNLNDNPTIKFFYPEFEVQNN